jgi:hypothetical protein
VVITADGVRADKFAGVLTVPWEALASKPAEPEPGGGVVLTYLRPGLVRRTGGWVVNRRQLLVAAGAIAANVWAGERLGADSPPGRLVQLGTGVLAVAAGALLVAGLRDLRRGRGPRPRRGPQ